MNNTSKPNRIDHFLVRVVEGHEDAIDINKILNRFGWKPSRSKTNGSFSAISTLEALYTEDREAAWSAIQTITEAWGNSLSSANGQIISGLGGIYHRHGDEVDLARMVRRLSTISPEELLTRAQALAMARGKRVNFAVSELAIAEYNKIRGPKLPDWNLYRQVNRKASTEQIRALAKVANEIASATVVPAPMFVDAAELLRATPDESSSVWR